MWLGVGYTFSERQQIRRLVGFCFYASVDNLNKLLYSKVSIKVWPCHTLRGYAGVRGEPNRPPFKVVRAIFC